MELRISVSGDPDGGWLVDVHDGDVNEVYRPDDTHKTAAMAAMFALTEHCPELENDLRAREEALQPPPPFTNMPTASESLPTDQGPANDQAGTDPGNAPAEGNGSSP